MFIWYIDNQNPLLMAKKKIKPSDLDLTPKATGSVQSDAYIETNDIHCPATQLDLCLTENTICVQSKYTVCDKTKMCEETLACNNTRKCPVTYAGCNTYGNQCIETGPNCVEKTAICQVRTEQIDCLTQLCGEMTVDLPCRYTEEDTCIEIETGAIGCYETGLNCTNKDCGEITPTDICMETRNIQCFQTSVCESSDTSCEDPSTE